MPLFLVRKNLFNVVFAKLNKNFSFDRKSKERKTTFLVLITKNLTF